MCLDLEKVITSYQEVENSHYSMIPPTTVGKQLAGKLFWVKHADVETFDKFLESHYGKLPTSTPPNASTQNKLIPLGARTYTHKCKYI